MAKPGENPEEWFLWPGSVIEAMQDAGASPLQIFEVFLSEAQLIVEYHPEFLPRRGMLEAVNKLVEVCSALLDPPRSTYRPGVN
jgi:hypothetical protein